MWLRSNADSDSCTDPQGSRRLWSQNPENLTAEERQRLAGLRQHFPAPARLADQRESRRALFDDRTVTTAEAGQQRLQDWRTAARPLGLNALNAFCKTLEHGLPVIANDFPQRSSIPTAILERTDGRLSSRFSHDPVASLRHVQLPTLSTAHPRPLRPTANTSFNRTSGEPEKPGFGTVNGVAVALYAVKAFLFRFEISSVAR